MDSPITIIYSDLWSCYDFDAQEICALACTCKTAYAAHDKINHKEKWCCHDWYVHGYAACVCFDNVEFDVIRLTSQRCLDKFMSRYKATSSIIVHAYDGLRWIRNRRRLYMLKLSGTGYHRFTIIRSEDATKLSPNGRFRPIDYDRDTDGKCIYAPTVAKWVNPDWVSDDPHDIWVPDGPDSNGVITILGGSYITMRYDYVR